MSPPCRPSRRWLSRHRSRRPSHPFVACARPAFLRAPWRRRQRGRLLLSLLRLRVRCSVATPALPAPSLAVVSPRASPSHLSSGPAATRPRPRAPAPGPGRQYNPKGRRCLRSDGWGCCASVVGRQIRSPWKMAEKSSRSRRGQHKPSPILTPPPEVAPRTLPPSVSTLSRPCGRARGGAGRLPGATAALLDRLSGPSAEATHRRNHTKPPRRSFSLPFFALLVTRPLSLIATRR